MTEQRTEIGDLGEFGLIRRLSEKFSLTNSTSIKGIGDDAAVIDTGGDYLLLSADMLVEGVHFNLAYAPLQHVGYKSVVVNVSDICAMNAIPQQITVSMALSNRFSVEAVDTLYEGIRKACENYQVDLVGGDTTSSASGLVLAISVAGRVPKDRCAYRSGSRPNDVLCVTGDLGAAYIGLQILERERQVYLTDPEMRPQLVQHEYLISRSLKPEARTDIVYDLMERKIVPTSMIDISDGLSSELLHIATSSGNGFRIFEDKVPIDNRTYETALGLNLDPLTCALNGGDDYELLFTVSPDDVEKIKDHPDIHLIGLIHDNPKETVLISRQGTVVPMQAQGWRSF